MTKEAGKNMTESIQKNEKAMERVSGKEKPTIKPTGSVVYIGPTISGIVKQNTVFNNGLTDELKKRVQEVPSVSALIVPIERLAATSAELVREGSTLNILYKRIQNNKGD